MTEVVRDWASGTRPSRGLWVKRFDEWQASVTEVRISYEGKAAALPPQAAGFEVLHRKAQTFITRTKIEKLIVDEKADWKTYSTAAKKGSPRGDVL